MFGPYIIKINLRWPKMKFFIWSIIKSTLRIDQKSKQFPVDRVADWPKVTNIFTYIFSLTKCSYNLLVAWNLMTKVPHLLQGSKNMTSKVQKEPQGPVWNVYFDLVNWYSVVWIGRIFIHFRPTKRTFISYIFRPTKCKVNNFT